MNVYFCFWRIEKCTDNLNRYWGTEWIPRYINLVFMIMLRLWLHTDYVICWMSTVLVFVFYLFSIVTVVQLNVSNSKVRNREYTCVFKYKANRRKETHVYFTCKIKWNGCWPRTLSKLGSKNQELVRNFL